MHASVDHGKAAFADLVQASPRAQDDRRLWSLRYASQGRWISAIHGVSNFSGIGVMPDLRCSRERLSSPGQLPSLSPTMIFIPSPGDGSTHLLVPSAGMATGGRCPTVLGCSESNEGWQRGRGPAADEGRKVNAEVDGKVSEADSRC